MSETTALGAAFAAGLAVGVWKDTDELSKTWSLGQDYESTMAAEKRDKVRCVTVILCGSRQSCYVESAAAAAAAVFVLYTSSMGALTCGICVYF